MPMISHTHRRPSRTNIIRHCVLVEKDVKRSTVYVTEVRILSVDGKYFCQERMIADRDWRYPEGHSYHGMQWEIAVIWFDEQLNAMNVELKNFKALVLVKAWE